MQRKMKRGVLAALPLLALPAFLMWFQSRPCEASTPDALLIQLVSRERRIIETELEQRNSNSVTINQALSRWQVLKQSVLAQGATVAEANNILLSAQQFRTTDQSGKFIHHWPILIEKAYINNKCVWVSVCAVKALHPANAEIVTGWDYVVLVIDPQTPAKHQGTYTANCTFPRCYGPNSPFPIKKF